MIKFLLLVLLFVVTSVNSSLGINQKDVYLDERLKQSKVEVAKIHIQEHPPVEVKSYELQSDKLWNHTLVNHRVFLVRMLEKIVVLIQKNNKLLVLEDNATSYSNGSFAAREVGRIPRDYPIKFIRSIVWKRILYLLICYETGPCSLYTGLNNVELKYRQTIRHRGLPVDASFFIRDNQLYLVVADNSGQLTVPSVIYDWRGTYMDMVDEMLTTAAISVTTFKHKQSTIIVFAQNHQSNPGIGSLVYEFRDNKAQRIQFLPTVGPVSVHHYDYARFNFVLFINKNQAGTLFWWDGQELLKWEDLPEIRAAGLNRVVKMKDDLFYFAGENNILQLYKIQGSSNCVLVGSLTLETGHRPIDVHVQANESVIIAFLLIKDQEDKQWTSVESWELSIKEASHGSSIEERDPPSKCLADLIEILSERMPGVQRVSSFWPSLYPSAENVSVSEKHIGQLESLILESGSLGQIELIPLATDELITIPVPTKIQEIVENLSKEVDDLSLSSQHVLMPDKGNTLTGEILVRGNASFDELRIDSLDADFWNQDDLRKKNIRAVRSAGESSPLRGKTIVVEDLQVDSLCGIPPEYWALKNAPDTFRLQSTNTTKMELLNDTIIVDGDLLLADLHAETINNINIQDFLDNIFLCGSSKTINASLTYLKPLKVRNLTTGAVNGIPAENFLDRTTNQSFNEFFIKTIEIERLYADLINGVPVNESARISGENLIKGELNLAELYATEELIIDDPELDEEELGSLQVYANVTLEGDVTVQNIHLDPSTIVLLNNKTTDFQGILEQYWTKSTKQEIQEKVVFNNLIIDELNAQYLNGFSQDDFLYTDIVEIPEDFTELHFNHFEVDDSFIPEDTNSSLIEFSNDSLIFRKDWHVDSLSVNDLLTVKRFNDIPMEHILNLDAEDRILLNQTNFSRIQAKQVNAKRIYSQLLNKRKIEDSPEVLLPEKLKNQNATVDVVKIAELHVEHLIVDRINDIELEKFTWLRNRTMSSSKDLTLLGDLVVSDDMKINEIVNELSIPMPPELYLDELLEADVLISSEAAFEKLIVEAATLDSLHQHNVQQFFHDIFSKSRNQEIPGNFSFANINANNVSTNYINNQPAAELMWTDSAIFITGNITFDDLHVGGDILAKLVNGYEPEKLYDSLTDVTLLKNLSYLHLDGHLLWENSSNSLNSITFLITNALSRDSEETLYKDIIFENGVSVSVFSGELEGQDEIQRIVSDAVIDNGEMNIITAEKTMKEGLIVEVLSVTDYINISRINDIDILELNQSIIRKYEENQVLHNVTFLGPVTINELEIPEDVHGIPMSKLALSTDILPSNVVFKDLSVLGNLYLKNLDGIDFDQFLKNRATLHGDNVIHSDIQFNGFVDVTGNAAVLKINSFDPSDFLLNGIESVQFLSGSKTFEKNLVISGNLSTLMINNLKVTPEYQNGVKKGDNVEIHGNMEFLSKINLPRNTSISTSLMNDGNWQSVFSDINRGLHSDLTSSFEANETSEVEEKVKELSQLSFNLPKKFLYLEEEEILKIRLPNIKTVEPLYFGDTVKLKLYGEESSRNCGLPQTENCSCPSEYIVQFSGSECDLEKTNGSARTWYFHEPHGMFGVRIDTNTISHSRECSLEGNEEEFSTISWMKAGISEAGDVMGYGENVPLKIKGFIKDAQIIFNEKNEAYIILAIYYDPEAKTHYTESLIYKLNFETNDFSLYQKVMTDAAWDIEVFEIDSSAYFVIGCFGTSSKSPLYKLDYNKSETALVRTFGSRSRHVKSFSYQNDYFLLIDDFETYGVNIFKYKSEVDKFYSYQNFFYYSEVQSIECFYSDAIQKTDGFLVIATRNGEFFIYEYTLSEKFKIKVHYWVDSGLQTMVPFYKSGQGYFFTGAVDNNSTILRIVQEGPNV